MPADRFAATGTRERCATGLSAQDRGDGVAAYPRRCGRTRQTASTSGVADALHPERRDQRPTGRCARLVGAAPVRQTKWAVVPSGQCCGPSSRPGMQCAVRPWSGGHLSGKTPGGCTLSPKSLPALWRNNHSTHSDHHARHSLMVSFADIASLSVYPGRVRPTTTTCEGPERLNSIAEGPR